MIRSNRSKILVVDDKAENLYAMESLLEGCKADIFMAQSGNEALALTLHHNFALVLLDVQMPEMDGFETAYLIRQDEETRKIPIIFMTALNKEEHFVFKGYENGAVDYLIKPVNTDILLSKVRVFLELDRYQHELSALNQKYQLLFNCAGEGILGIQRSGHIHFANKVAAQILGYSEEHLCNSHLSDLLYSKQHSDPPAWEQSSIYMAYLDGQTYKVQDTVLWSSEQHPIPVEYNSAPLKDEAGSFVGGVIIFQDITLRKKAEEELLKLAQYDPLTGLANRGLFQDFLNFSIARAQRRRGHMAVLILDLDHFKDINDTLGHDTGDRLLKSVAQRIQFSVAGKSTEPDQDTCNAHLLKSVAQRLKNNLRRSDLVARLGGDEFAVILDEITQPQDAAVVAQKILHSLAPPHQLDHYEVYISPSIGIATYPASNADAEDLVKAADTALYQAKAQGRNNYQFYAPEMHRSAMERVRLEHDLRYAIKRGQLFLHYQPQINVIDDQLAGIEVLLRWRHPELGMITPEKIIQLAERTGTINEIGDWILNRACQQFNIWRQLNLISDEVKLAMNISSRQLARANLAEEIQEVLIKSGFPSNRLSIELTENSLLDEKEVTGMALNELRALGVQIALDDFGTGYSSFNQLHSLPIDCLKVGRPFISKIGEDTKNDAVVKTIIGLAHTLGFRLIAEGVETQEQLDFLQAHGCSCMQGFYLSPPLSDQMITKLLISRLSDRLPGMAEEQMNQWFQEKAVSE